MYERIVRIGRTNYFIYETLVGLVLLLTINLVLLPGKPAFEGVNPNPLWIIVLAIPIRYGRRGAIFAGIASAAVFLSQYIWMRGLDAIYDDLWILRFPIMFVLIGFILGEVKTVFMLREDYLTSRVEELQNENERLSKENEIVKEAHSILTANVATKQDTITILNEITARLKSYDADVIYKGILEGFRDDLGAEECSFYVAEGDDLRLHCSIGWKDYQRRPDQYKIGQGLIGASAKALQVMSIKDFIFRKRLREHEETDIMGDTILAIPVVGIDDRLYGVASIESMPLMKLTDTTVQTARVVCELAASSLNNAYAFKAMEEIQIRDRRFNVYRYHYFLARANEEFLRSTNYMLPLSAMAFKWPRLKGLSDASQAPLIESIITVLKARLRAFDVLAVGPDEKTPLVLLLATTSGPQAEDIKQKMIAHIKEYELSGVLAEGPIEETIVTAAYNPHTMSGADDLLKALEL